MACSTCGGGNPADARFCGGCGSPLAPRCPACGAPCEGDVRFCHACGSRVRGDAAEKAIARKLVTVVFADLIGSMSLHERLDAESGRRVIDRYHRAMSAAVERHGGRVVQLLGDGVLAAFGVPRVAEDDAIRAVRAAVAMQRAFRELVQEHESALSGIGLRVAVNTGEVVVSNDETAVIGDPTNVASRLQHEARDGDVIIGEGTERLVADEVTLGPLGSFALRGRAGAVNAFRVVSLEAPASVRTTAFVGREAEVQRLLGVLEATIAKPAAHLAVLLGSPGLGKSRLLAEVSKRAGERATVLAARCDAAGGATFAPIAEALRALLRFGDGAGSEALRSAIEAVVPEGDVERSRIAAAIEAIFSGAPPSPEETFFAVRRLLAGLAAERPVVLAIDDLHWAEPLLLDLIEHLVQWSSGVPLLVLGAARPELRDLRSSLATPGGLAVEVVTLGGLDASAALQLAWSVLGATELPAALLGRVLATSEGNPLFLGELVRMLVQDGTLRRDGDRWVTTVEVAKLDMPPTIQVLLAARIERLRPEERVVLERAAVIGRRFSRDAVAHLLPGGTTDLDARLEALRRSELIEPEAGWYLGEPALRFHHVLIRDAAYRRVLKETRAELHERFADWIAARGTEGAEREEALGWHLEQAHVHLRELGPLDERGRSLGERAALHLGDAGRRALAREDLALAASLLGRAIEAAPPEHALRAELAPDWCEALLSAGEVAAAARAIDELGRSAGSSERLRAWHACFAGQLAALTDPQSLRETADRVAGAAGVLARLEDAAGEAKAHSVHAAVLARLGAIGASEIALDDALAAARRANDRRRANAVLAGAPIAALWGPSPVTRASGRCLDVVRVMRVLRITEGAPAVEAVALRAQAILETLRGREEAARRMIASSRRIVEELGIAQQVLETDVFEGILELLEGDPAAAEARLRTAHRGLAARGLGIDAARAAALLGRALLALGRAEEAETASHESEAIAGDDLKAAIAWRGVRAEALARRGEIDEALPFARAAVEIAAETDALLDHADARIALATVLRAAGRAVEAEQEERRALELWEAKGAVLLIERARAARAGLAHAPTWAIVRPSGHDTGPSGGPRPYVRPNAATAELLRCEEDDDPRDPCSRWLRPNAAVAASQAVDRAIRARDWTAVSAVFPPTARLEDRRRLFRTTIDAEAARGAMRWAVDGAPDLEIRRDLVAVYGERLELERQTWRGTRLGAPFEIEMLALIEADEQGKIAAVSEFDPDDRRTALREARTRFAAIEPALAPLLETISAYVDAVTDRDLERLRALHAPDVVSRSSRRSGAFALEGVDACVERVRALWQLASEGEIEILAFLALEPFGAVGLTRAAGISRDGGAFEILSCTLILIESGRFARFEQFEPDQADRALALFAELGREHAARAAARRAPS